MLPNEVFALACRAYYEEQGLIVDETNGEFAHCPYPEGMGDTGYYLLHGHHQHQGLLQSKDVGKCCFFVGHAKKWLQECDYFPEGYFDLWETYEEYCGENGRKVAQKFLEDGVGVFNPIYQEKINEARVRNGKRAFQEKTGIHDPKNREIVLEASQYALKNGVGLYDPRNQDKIQENRVRNGINAVKNKTGAFSPEGQEKRTKRAREMMSELHSEKDDSGKSTFAVRNCRKLHAEKDDQGRSLVAMRSLQQKWKSTVDGHISTASGVASHNRSRGWDPNARVRVS
jgi:hypothetical protein